MELTKRASWHHQAANVGAASNILVLPSAYAFRSENRQPVFRSNLFPDDWPSDTP
jgi:hypothetical protein